MTMLLVMRVVLIATIAIGISGGILAWRERPAPGAVALTALLGGQCWWSAALFFRINATGLDRKILWMDLSWVGIAVLPVAWLFFCLSYAGRNRYVRPRYVAAVAVIPATTAVLGPTNVFHGLLYAHSSLVAHAGQEVLVRTPGVWFWVIAGYTYLLGLLGAIPLLEFIGSDLPTFRGQSLALLVGLVIPWVTNALYLVGALPTAGIDPTPVAFSLSAVAFLGALTRFRLLGTSPAPIRPARRYVFDLMKGGIIVLDRQGTVVEMNDRAAAIVSTEGQEPLGSPIEAVVPRIEELTDDHPGSRQTVYRPEDGHGAYDIAARELFDAHGRRAGSVVTLHDISEYLRQQQRLEVLNRVFRHNIRTNLQVLLSSIESLADEDGDPQAEKAKATALEIEEFSRQIRTILDVFERGRTETRPLSLAAILADCIQSIESRYPEVTVDTDVDVAGIYVDSVMDDVLGNIVENAAQHNTNDDPRVRIEAIHRDDQVRVVVSDNGPGIEIEELALLTEGTETTLHHGTGLGLALIVWGTEVAGGSVTFEDNEPTGTVVTLEVPTLSRSEAPESTSLSEPTV